MTNINTRKRGKKWEYYFEIPKMDGKRKRVSKGGFDTKAEAASAGAMAFSEFKNMGQINNPSYMSLHDYLNYWIEMYCQPNLKPSTVENYRKYIRVHIDPKIGKYPLANITSEQLQSLINSLVNREYSKNTILGIKGVLSSSFEYAVYPLKYIVQSPMAYVKIPRGSKSTYKTSQYVRTAIEPEIIDKIFERFPKGTSTYLPMMFAYRCGMRLGEAYAITWNNVDFENRTITIDKQLQWDTVKSVWHLVPPKYNSRRTIDIDQFIIDLLTEIKVEQERARDYYAEEYTYIHYNKSIGINTTEGEIVKFVNVNEDGSFIQPRTMQHASHVIHKFYPEFNFHSLRHTHCTRLLEAGLPIKYVQERLGHKNINVTMDIYNHLTQSQAEKSKQVLEDIF